MSEQLLTVPIKLEVGASKKKTYWLNLNGFRNWQFQVANMLKKSFKIETIGAVRDLTPVTKPVRVTYTIFYPTKRAFDVDNIGTVVCKFTMDVLTEVGVIVDDNYNYVPEIDFRFGGVDKENPRCEVLIKELEND